jgi:hypothetical protein
MNQPRIWAGIGERQDPLALFACAKSKQPGPQVGARSRYCLFSLNVLDLHDEREPAPLFSVIYQLKWLILIFGEHRLSATRKMYSEKA